VAALRAETIGRSVSTIIIPLVVAMCATSGPARAQQDSTGVSSDTGLFPSALVVRPLIGGPYANDIGGGPIWARRDPPSGSGNLSPEADVSFGYRLPLYRFLDGANGGPALDLAVEAGLDARFALGHGQNGLINADFRAALPVGMRFSRSWEATFALAHVSSHLGDNLLEQAPDLELKRISRNGLEGTVIRRVVGGLRAYVGSVYNFATTGTEDFALRAGLNFDRMAGDPRPTWFVGSLDLQWTDLVERVSVDAGAGIGIRTGAGELQLGLTGHVGPSGMGQFRTQDEKYFGLFLRVVPGVVARSGLRR